MKVISIQGTAETPYIHFDMEKGMLDIRGRSISPDPTEFYRPVVENLTTYASAPVAVTNVIFQLEYFNTSSARCILALIRQLADLHNKGHRVVITWRYEDGDENMRDAGIDYQAIVNMPFMIEQMPAE